MTVTRRVRRAGEPPPGEGGSTTRQASAWVVAAGLHRGAYASAPSAAGTGLAPPTQRRLPGLAHLAWRWCSRI